MSREEKLRDIYGFDSGVAWENKRIIELLKEQKASMEAMETGYRSTSGNMAIRIKTIEALIEIIGGEQK